MRNAPTEGIADLAKTMGASKWQLLRHIQLPAALPTLALRHSCGSDLSLQLARLLVKWVGSSEEARLPNAASNARMIIDEMFAALFILAVLSISLYFITNKLLKKAILGRTSDINNGSLNNSLFNKKALLKAIYLNKTSLEIESTNTIIIFKRKG
ncbi:ABC transporter permease subunit [Vibrio chagasii]|nr:ABC transporter permease subunit [Vibrio chagasii]